MNYDLITILGPTASGKTPLAAALAARLHTEIISGDSRQIYRRMDLGTGKDLVDYVVDGQQIPYHLIDIVEPGYKYNVFEYQRDFLKAYEDIRSRGLIPVLCGGTGMYLESVLKGYRLLPVPENPELRSRLADKSLEAYVPQATAQVAASVVITAIIVPIVTNWWAHKYGCPKFPLEDKKAATK